MHATWYFDFVSPFAWLQFSELRSLPRYPVLQPVVLARLLEAHGQLGPAEIPAKREFTYRHVSWLAARTGVPLHFPRGGHPFNSIPLLRLALACDGDPAVVERLFRYVWVEGHLPQEPAPWRGLLAELGQREEVSEGVKLGLREATERAIERGVFGVPTTLVGDRLFWGLDVTGMLRECLRDPAAFATGPGGLAVDVPVAASRRRAR